MHGAACAKLRCGGQAGRRVPVGVARRAGRHREIKRNNTIFLRGSTSQARATPTGHLYKRRGGRHMDATVYTKTCAPGPVSYGLYSPHTRKS